MEKPPAVARYSYESMFSLFSNIAHGNVYDYASKLIPLRLPIIPPNFLLAIISKVTEIFMEEPTILDLESSVVIVGDLHGHILDLFRIFTLYNNSNHDYKFLFLGDIVDRGEFSTETVAFIFLMKVLFPTKYFIIRGNHEFEEICERSGFLNELQTIYNNPSIFKEFITAFSYIPIAAKIDGHILSLHGGVGPGLNSIHDIESHIKPFNTFEGNDLLTEILWSDPNEKITGFSVSDRGYGHCFGEDALNNFLGTEFDILIRGHQCVDEGVRKCFNGKLITVFSASHYCGTNLNFAGIMVVHKDKPHELITFPVLPYLRRRDVSFMDLIALKRSVLFAGHSSVEFRFPARISINNNDPNDPSTASNGFDKTSLKDFKHFPQKKKKRLGSFDFGSFAPIKKPKFSIALL